MPLATEQCGERPGRHRPASGKRSFYGSVFRKANNRSRNSYETLSTLPTAAASSSSASSSEEGFDSSEDECCDADEENDNVDDSGPCRPGSYIFFKTTGSCRKPDSKFRIQVSTFAKVLLSFTLWITSYMFMAIFGGTVAFLHFPRTDLPQPDPLPDFGYDVIQPWCPVIPGVPHDNVQSVVLLVLYMIILTGVVMRWGTDGRIVFQRLLHLNVMVFATRTTTVGLTGLPQPNPRCVEVQSLPVNYLQALRFVVGRGFPPRACGDLIYSGHVGCTLVCMTIFTRHGYLRRPAAFVAVWGMALLGIYATISCRSHYTVDVVLACYFVYFMQEYYYLRCEGVVGGKVAEFIQWIERDDDDDDDEERDEEEADQGEKGRKGGRESISSVSSDDEGSLGGASEKEEQELLEVHTRL